MITTLYAGLLGLIYLGLTAFVVRGRWKHKVSLGDGGNEDVFKRVRVHSNFIEYVPIALILMILLEIEQASEIVIHVLGVMLVLGRLMHAIGTYKTFGVSIGRSGGMILTILCILFASILCFIAYFSY